MKVLIIGPRFHYFNQSVERAFRALGHQAFSVAFDNPVHPYTWSDKVRYKLASPERRLEMKRRSRDAWQHEIDSLVQSYGPNLVFVMNGDMLLPQTLLKWRTEGADVILWYFDSVTRIPLSQDCAPAANLVFCYEQTDIALLRQRFGIEAHFLPQAVDDKLYAPIKGASDKSLDIVFAGDMVYSRRRRDIIQSVVARYPQLRIRVWGNYKPWFKGLWSWLTRERRDVYMNRNASASELNRDYNAARLVLNIHVEQQHDGANPKVYEIAASGAYQVCDANPYIESLFAHGEVGLYHNQDELFALIDDALQHDHQSDAEAARALILQQHTFVNRIQQCLSLLA